MIVDLIGYASRYLAWMLLLAVAPAAAVVCKSIDEHGVVSYTDTPKSECEHPVKLPGYSRYAPRPVSGSADSGASKSGDQGPEKSSFAGYTDMQIVEPKNQGTLRNDEGEVSVEVVLQPDLQNGHRIRVILDGRMVGAPVASTALTLKGVDRGTHSLSVQVLDENDKILRSVGPIRFTLHREVPEPSASDSQPQGDDVFEQKYDPEKNQQQKYNPETDQGSSFVPGEPSDDTFGPGDSPNGFKAPPDTYSPGSGSKTKGTNPAFTPHYNQKK